MKEYNYTTRRQLLDEYKKRWEKKCSTVSEEVKELFKENNTSYYEGKLEVEKVIAAMKKQDNLCPSQYMEENYKELIDLYVPKKEQKDFYYIIDKYNKFQYAEGISRRSVRSKEYEPHFHTIFRLLDTYYQFGIYECDLNSYLLDQMDEEKRDYKYNYGYYSRLNQLDDIIAAKLDLGDAVLKKSIQDMILSENNTGIVTTDIIRGIIKSDDKDLHTLLGDFLLAARLQEGIRQAICENMDCGVTEAFLTLFDVIYENNLIRFSSVKRAIATWTGICDENNVDRITGKMLDLMKEGVHNKEKALAYTKSNDSIEIMIGLWSLGFFEVGDAVEVMKEYVESGTKNQKLTMSYYNRCLSYQRFSEIAAKKMIEKHYEDMEFVAAFIPTYLSEVENLVYHAMKSKTAENGTVEKIYKKVPVTELFESREEAQSHFEMLKYMYEKMKKKKMEYNPCIFPWYSISISKSQLAKRICMTAYMLQEDLYIDYAVSVLSAVDSSDYYSGRDSFLELLLHNPKNEFQKETLIKAVSDRETSTRETAFTLVEKMQLEQHQYIMLEDMMKYKNADVRNFVIGMLCKRNGEDLINSVGRLLQSKKEESRIGGLDLVLQCQKEESQKLLTERMVELVEAIENPSAKEQILIQEICEGGVSNSILNEKGYGLYNPDALVEIPVMKGEEKVFKDFFSLSKKKIQKLFDKLDQFIEEHRTCTYENRWGEKRLLGNGLEQLTWGDGVAYADQYPFKELWCEFYNKEIKDFRTLYNMYLAVHTGLKEINNQDVYKKYETAIFGKALEIDLSSYKYGSDGTGVIYQALCIIISLYFDEKTAKELSRNILIYIIESFPEEALWYQESKYQEKVSFLNSYRMNKILSNWRSWDGEEEFKIHFYLFYQIDQKFQLNGARTDQNGHQVYCSTQLNIFDYIMAYCYNLISKDEVYKASFEYFRLTETIKSYSYLLMETVPSYDKEKTEPYGLVGEINKESPFCKAGISFYKNIIDVILNVELKRGDTPTIFSESILKINEIYGMERMVEVLTALGKDKLDRNTDTRWRTDTRKSSCLSHLLQVCIPNPEDKAETLKELLTGREITEQRLVDTAMYAPQWIDIVEEYLGYKGLKSGCYYFMAHMSEYFDERKMAMIAKFTPLSREELYRGAFDLNWFKDAYKQLGEAVFSMLYEGAKYISDGSKHARARKYADAALGKVSIAELEEAVNEKRNKDLVMSYGLVPLSGKKDMLHRYVYLQKFLKESKQFGAQRRASEAEAVEMAMKNLAMVAGYSDVMRLTLSMETELIKSCENYFEWKELGEVSLRIQVDEFGKSSICCMKKGKALKSVPATLKKDEYVAAMNEVHKKLKDQYSRTVKMFEQSMEDREVFLLSEILELNENPVAAPIIRNLVYVTVGKEDVVLGFPSKSGLVDYAGNEQPVTKKEKIRVAHPFDLYQAGYWTEYQKYFFESSEGDLVRKQPFKQVFRELYVKMPEEQKNRSSQMFAGNQIQPHKTVACLRGRRWIADYEEGLQKVYYKDDIVARIYAMADWFSPSDIEAPTLEWVDFSHRKTFQSLTIEEVPDIVYSEVMRDVDLAISVAHAGGVDPETSHSTIEMRSVIVGFNLPMFGIKNVTLEGSHAIIKGTRAEYSIHLGSGVIHKIGGPQINVLPVHSQSRGKLFLPFIDEDPKTAEIMSKIVLFAKDEKIKNPFILNQL
ncbi:DUF4132 domain-containing protein [Anaeromicropila populeti]|uniref:DUF4132 domain-containing protein n=1 Tax=Anaeromicropila populeti TaxID=37658 RepID=A0A1I6JNQ9_9FIRM|nr:DUF4132 domain-containing protein [Anaeromicropila populeti]SFR80608.1 protein of unknown function [Anaeromicropila populeti]